MFVGLFWFLVPVICKYRAFPTSQETPYNKASQNDILFFLIQGSIVFEKQQHLKNSKKKNDK